jgi:large subunit ribosomal protein L29
MKSRDKVREIRELDIESLKAKEKEFAEELCWLRIKQRSGQLPNYSSLKKMRKDLARVKTFMNAKEAASKSSDKRAK